MNIQEIFKSQVDKGATEMFFYGLERPEPHTISIMRHKGSLDTFPANLEFVRMMSESTPLFKAEESEEDSTCPLCGEDGGTTCGIPDCQY